MALTTAQLQTLKAAIAAETDPAFVEYLANGGEALYATGTGTDAAPGALVFEGNLNPTDITAARNLE
jgi:hypothetical protein